MTSEQLLQILTDQENQPHQFVGDSNALSWEIDKIIKEHLTKTVFPFSRMA